MCSAARSAEPRATPNEPLFGRDRHTLLVRCFLRKRERTPIEEPGNGDQQAVPPGQREMAGKLPVDLERTPIIYLPIPESLEQNPILVMAHFEVRAGALCADIDQAPTVELKSVPAGNVMKRSVGERE